MVPVPISARNSHSSRLVYILFTLASQYAPRIFNRSSSELTNVSVRLAKRDSEFNRHDPKSIVFAVLIPVLVLSSGLFAGLTLGYMSLDETQLSVLSISGTPEQRKYANKIMPIRKNGHLLLVTLLLANMIVNESLPVIADPILGGGVQSVIVSTVLIVIFAEIIPQSLFTRHGLYLGAKMAGFTKILIYAMGIIAWPVAKLLEFVLGAHHGIIYRRAELKELIAMHSSGATHGGDLKTDTVTIIGATLDLQEKVVKQAMTPISDVFMLSIDSKLDYNLLKKICQTGHSRVPVYEEIDVPVSVVAADETLSRDEKQRTLKVKKIIGILLVKQCVLLDPHDATPLRKIPLNKVPFVPNNEPLLGILDKFQEGRSHMAIVSRFSVDKAASVKKAVKRGLTQRLRERVGMGDSDSDTDSSEEEKNVTPIKTPSRRRRLMDGLKRKNSDDSTEDTETVAPEDGPPAPMYEQQYDVEKGMGNDGIRVESPTSVKIDEKVNANTGAEKVKKEEGRKSEEGKKAIHHGFQLRSFAGMTNISAMEQSMPADAVLAKKGAAEFLQGFDPAVMPLGIITLEDVLEELIGEEIYDEFDTQGAHGDPYEVPPAQPHDNEGEYGKTRTGGETPITRPSSVKTTASALSGQLPTALKGLGFFRTRSAPPIPRDENDHELEMVENNNRTGKTVRIGEASYRSENKSGTHEPGHNVAAAGNTSNTLSISSSPIQMPKPIRSHGRHPPSVILEQHSSVSSSDSGVGQSLVNVPAPVLTGAESGSHPAPFSGGLPVPGADGKNKTLPSAGPIAPSFSSATVIGRCPATTTPSASTPVSQVAASVPDTAHKVDKVPSRSTSPVPTPTLEAILLDRKRRMAASHGAQLASSGTPVASAAPSPAPSLGMGLGLGVGMLGLGVGNGGKDGHVSSGSGGGTPSSLVPPIVISSAPSLSSSGSAGGASAVSHMKGTRFKSSPLGGGERAGVVVAEQVKAASSKENEKGQE